MLNGKTHSSQEKSKKIEVTNEDNNNSKVRSVSLKKLSENQPKKPKTSVSVFKIRNTTSSINKMYC